MRALPLAVRTASAAGLTSEPGKHRERAPGKNARSPFSRDTSTLITRRSKLWYSRPGGGAEGCPCVEFPSREYAWFFRNESSSEERLESPLVPSAGTGSIWATRVAAGSYSSDRKT